jgi:hypothetical protein
MKATEVDKKFNLPTRKPRTICICGSTKFKDDMMAVAKEKTLNGYIVVMPLVFAHSGDEITEEQKTALDGLHLHKIKMSAYICVVCQDYYVGKSTIREMLYAYERGKVIQVFNNGVFVFGFHKTKANPFSLMIQRFSQRSQEIYKEITEAEGGKC